MAPIDPHSYTDSSHPLTTHVSLSLFISAMIDPATGTPLPFTLDPLSPDAVLGQSIIVTLSNQSQLLVLSKIVPSSSTLQWMSPPQTFNKSYPFVYTQCQAIHARSIFPYQDTPAARIKFPVKLNILRYLSAMMVEKHLDRRDPVSGECHGACNDSLWYAEGRIVEEFVMEQPIPPYLFGIHFSSSFYPQVILNFRCKSVVGLNFDFVVLNLTKHSSYLIYNASLFFSSTVQRQYREKFGLDEMIPVATNDVAFSAHAVLLTIFTLFQIVIYDVVSLLV
ncbi:hypothetical protein C2S51_025278 [Perilla frutescens var. frutescens]|nr:hypothetical protein C2S51_025278 [Perilla frutescens var. frutescens]